MRGWAFSVVLWLAWPVFALPTFVHAQADGEQLREGGFNVDLVTGPVLGTGRITGLGGAYTALATGIDGAAWNPAAYAERTLWSVGWFDWDLTLNANPGTVGAVDFDNSGAADTWRSDPTMTGAADQRFQYTAAGLGLQFGAFGIGLLVRSEEYRIELPRGEGVTSVALVTGHYGIGHLFMDGQLSVGAGVRSAGLTIVAPQGETTAGMDQSQSKLVNFVGASVEAGALLRLSGAPWRLGVAARMPVVSVVGTPSAADDPVNGVSALPKEVRLPWEVSVGLAWQFGPRPLNRGWRNPHDTHDQLEAAMLARRASRARAQWALEQRQARELELDSLSTVPAATSATGEGVPSDAQWWQEELRRQADEQQALEREEGVAQRRAELAVKSLSREYLLLTGDVILVGATANGVGVESFLSGVRQASGETISVGLRFGAELEPIAHWLKVRGGTYLEPSRYAGRPYRPHGTLGFDVRLFTWDLFGWVSPFTFRLGASLDTAPRYTNFGLSIGMWH